MSETISSPEGRKARRAAAERKRRAADPEKYRAYNREAQRSRRAADPEKYRAYNRAYKRRRRAANREKYREADREWRDANPEKIREANRRWNRANPAKCNAHSAARRAQRLRATPPWANQALITAVYEAAARKGLVVDRVIPLQHPLVCGLHVPFNLQLLTKSQNSAKGNRFDV